MERMGRVLGGRCQSQNKNQYGGVEPMPTTYHLTPTTYHLPPTTYHLAPSKARSPCLTPTTYHLTPLPRLSNAR